MEVTRTQYPIGQGCFHAGHVRWTQGASRQPDDFRYVHDCGSSDGSAALQDAIVAWQNQTSRLDALFVSHLDADHVNGIDRLLGSVSVDTVYIPYADAVTQLVEILEAEMEGALSASLIEARLDPRSWFGRRGVERIVSVRASLGEGPPGTEPSPFDDDGPVEESAPGIRLPPKVPFDAKVRSQSPGEQIDGPILESMDSGAMVVVNPGQHLLWVLVPHVDPTPTDRRRAFSREVRQVLGLQPYQRLKTDLLVTALRDHGERARLRKCYEQIISGGSGYRHNRVSMSLYSGPADVGGASSCWLAVPRAAVLTLISRESLVPYDQ